jgi:hypothetical protein
MHKPYAWHYMQIKVFAGSEFWISGNLLLSFIEIWDVTGGDGAADGGDDSMDTSESRLGPSGTQAKQVQQISSSVSVPRAAHTMAYLIAVMPFNLNP